MLSPSRLFFGTEEPAVPELPLGDAEFSPDDKPGLVGSVLDLLDSDTEDQTDVPAEHSMEASLNESEEERRSPECTSRWPGDERFNPEGFRGGSAARFGLPERPPPGLPLLGGGGLASLAVGSGVAAGECPLPGILGGLGAPHGGGSNGDDSEDSNEDEGFFRGSHPVAAAGSANALAGAMGTDGVWYSELQLPSIGSVNHFNGTCDRCCFHPKGRCLNGYNCQHCHFDHEKRKRKNKKKAKGKGLSLDDGDMESSAGGSLPVSPDGSLAAHTSLGLEDFVVPTAAVGFPEFGMAASSHGQTGELGVSDFAVQRPPQFESLEEQTPPEVVAYIRQLEEENRYLRGCLAQYTASAPPGPMPGQQPPELPHMSVGGQQVSELSAAATPFFPGAGQNWQEQHGGGELCAAR